MAIDAATGEEIWMHSEREGVRAERSPRTLSGRGLAYWTDGRDERIFYVTPGYRLLANVGADSGQEVPHLHVHIFGGRPLGPMLSR